MKKKILNILYFIFLLLTLFSYNKTRIEAEQLNDTLYKNTSGYLNTSLTFDLNFYTYKKQDFENWYLYWQFFEGDFQNAIDAYNFSISTKKITSSITDLLKAVPIAAQYGDGIKRHSSYDELNMQSWYEENVTEEILDELIGSVRKVDYYKYLILNYESEVIIPYKEAHPEFQWTMYSDILASVVSEYDNNKNPYSNVDAAPWYDWHAIYEYYSIHPGPITCSKYQPGEDIIVIVTANFNEYIVNIEVGWDLNFRTLRGSTEYFLCDYNQDSYDKDEEGHYIKNSDFITNYNPVGKFLATPSCLSNNSQIRYSDGTYKNYLIVTKCGFFGLKDNYNLLPLNISMPVSIIGVTISDDAQGEYEINIPDSIFTTSSLHTEGMPEPSDASCPGRHPEKWVRHAVTVSVGDDFESKYKINAVGGTESDSQMQEDEDEIKNGGIACDKDTAIIKLDMTDGTIIKSASYANRTYNTTTHEYNDKSVADSGTSATITNSGKQFNLSLSNPGDSKWIKVVLQLPNGTEKDEYLYVSRALYGSCDLTGFSITDTGSTALGTSGTCGTFKPSFNKDVLNYSYEIPSDVNSVTIKPGWDINTNVTVTCDGNEFTYGNGVTLTSPADGASKQFIVTSQNGLSTKTYTVTIKKLSIDADLASSSAITINCFKNSTSNGSKGTSRSSTTYSASDIKYENNKFKFIAVVNDSKCQKVEFSEDGISWTQLSKSGTTCTSGFVSFSDVKTATTKSLTIRVTAEAGNTSTYTLNVNRKAASTNANITGYSIFAIINNVDVLVKSVSTGTIPNTIEVTGSDKVIYQTTGFRIQVTLDENAENATMTFDGVTLNDNTISSNKVSFTNGTTEETQTGSLVITPEYGTDYNNTYAFKVTRKSADLDKDITVELKDMNNNTIVYEADSQGNVWINPTAILRKDCVQVKYKAYMTDPTNTTTLISRVQNSQIAFGTNFINSQDFTGSFKDTDQEIIIDTLYIVPEKTLYSEQKVVTLKVKLSKLSTDATLKTPYITNGVSVISNKDNNHITLKNDGLVFSGSFKKVDGGDNYTFAAIANDELAKIKYSDNVNNLTTSNNAGTELSGSTTFDLGKTYYFKVVTEYGQYCSSSSGNKAYIIYSITINDEKNTENDIKSVIIKNKDGESIFTSFDKDTLTYNDIQVSFETKEIRFVIEAADGSKAKQGTGYISSYDFNISDLKEGANNYKLQCISESGLSGVEYSFKITRDEGNRNQQLTKVYVNGAEQEIKGNIIVCRLDKDITNASLVFEASENAKVTSYLDTNPDNKFVNILTPSYTVSSGKVNTIVIDVLSEYNKIENKGSASTYNLYIIPASNEAGYEEILFKSKSSTGSTLVDVEKGPVIFDSDKYSIENYMSNPITISYSSEDPYILVTPKNSDASLEGNSNSVVTLEKSSDGSEVTATITIKSQFYKLLENKNLTPDNYSANMNKYKVNIKRDKPNTNNEFKKVIITVNGTPYDITDKCNDSSSVTIDELGNASSYTIAVEPKVATSKCTPESKTNPLTLSDDEGKRSFSFDVTCTSEAEETRSVAVTLYYSSANLSSVYDILDIVLTSEAENSPYFTYDANTVSYGPFEIESKYTKYTLVVNNSLNSTIKINGEVFSNPNSGKEIKLAAGETKTLSIKSYAQDGTENPKTYVITVSRDDYDNDKTLSQLEFNKGGDTNQVITLQPDVYSYNVYVTNDVTEGWIFAKANSTNATLNVVYDENNKKPLVTNQSNDFLITVKADNPDLSANVYTVRVYRQPILTLDTLVLRDKKGNVINFDSAFNSDVQNYSVSVPYSIENVSFSYTPTDENSKVSNNKDSKNILLEEGSNTYEITVEGWNNVKRVYTIDIFRASGSDDNYITKYIKEDGETLTINKSQTSYSYVLPRNTSVFNPVIEVSENAEVALTSGDYTLIPGTANQKTFTVESETGEKRVYTFTIYTADVNTEMDNIELFTNSNCNEDLKNISKEKALVYDKNTKSYNITIPYKTDVAYLKVTKPDFGYIYMKKNDGVDELFTNQLLSIPVGTTTYTLYCKSEYGYLNPYAPGTIGDNYVITITRNVAGNDDKLKDLQVIIGGVNVLDSFDPENRGPYVISDVSATTVRVEATANDDNAVVTGAIGNNDLNDTLATDGVFILKIGVTTEGGVAGEPYTISISRGSVNLNDDNSINYITVTDSNNIEYLGRNKFQAETTSYAISIPYGAQSFTIDCVKPNGSPSTFHEKRTYQIGVDIQYGVETEYICYVISESGIKGTEYSIKVTCVSPDTACRLSELKVDGVRVVGFNPDHEGNTTYTYNLPSMNAYTLNILISGTLENNSCILEPVNAFGYKPVTEGFNIFTISVYSQDRRLKTEYKITFNVESKTPTLLNLSVDGEILLSETDKQVTFDPNIYIYHVFVTYFTEQVNVVASYNNSNYYCTCGTAASSQVYVNSTVFLIKNLVVGANTVNVTIHGTNNTEQTYTIIITRRNAQSADTSVLGITIDEIPEMGNDFIDSRLNYNYQVKNNINSLNVKVILNNPPTLTNVGATYTVYNAQNLKSGNNDIFVYILAEDKVSSRVFKISVEREKMVYNINENATDYEFKKDESLDNHYYINLGKDKANSIKNYKDYIDTLDQDWLTVDVLSEPTEENDYSDVILVVSDGTNNELVRLSLTSDAKVFSTNNLWILILFLAGLLLLIIIIICVNKDKYGVVTKNRKKY